jgi:hypothetical protein
VKPKNNTGKSKTANILPEIQESFVTASRAAFEGGALLNSDSWGSAVTDGKRITFK